MVGEGSFPETVTSDVWFESLMTNRLGRGDVKAFESKGSRVFLNTPTLKKQA